MDNNTRIETQPVVEQQKMPLEVPVFPEKLASDEAIGGSSDSEAPKESLPAKTVVKTPNEVTVGVEVSAEIPKPSAGFPIKNEDTGVSRIVLEKLIGEIENL